MANEDELRRLAEILSGLRKPAVGFDSPTTPGLLLDGATKSTDSDPRQKVPVMSTASEDAGSQLTRLIESLERNRSFEREQVQTLAQSTSVILQAANGNQSRPESVSARAGGGLNSMTGQFFLSPVIGALLSLFGGGKPEPPPPLPTYTLPPSIRLDAGYSAASDGSTRLVDREQSGLPRLIQTGAPAPQITVQVQTFDSRSFLDHSDEIARAVRSAVLNSHSLNDVMSEL